jgi:ATP/maltotriose-dependent transcriptional regulator MalT/DNA-binding SARP family transcriptional activator
MDSELIIQPKVIIPGKRQHLISRQRLLNLLNDLLDYKLILVIAPGGYGKTSLLIDYASQNEAPTCWYTLDHLDQDFRRFLIHFTASIAYRFPNFIPTHQAVIQISGTPDINAASAARYLANAIYEAIQIHFVLVLDDFQQVNDSQEITEFVSLFIQQASENVHLVILSRSLLQLPDLSLLVSRSQAAGLGYRELAFQPDEILTLMSQKFQAPITGEQAHRLYEESEGWITGLLMSSRPAMDDLAAGFGTAPVAGIGLSDYLAEQIFARQPAGLQDFLLRTSIFDEFNASLCSRVLGPPPEGTVWKALIEQVIQENLFVLPIGGEQGWVRYHHLFRSFLQNRLSLEKPEEEREIWLRYAAASAGEGDYERAYEIYQRLGDLAAVAELLQRIGAGMVAKGQIRTLSKWLDVLTPDIYTSYPFLAAMRGICSAVLANPKQGLQLLDQAAETLGQDRGSLNWLIPTLTWRAFVHHLLSNYHQSIADSEAVIALCGESSEYSTWLAEAARIRGLNYRLMGRLEQSIHSLAESLERFQRLSDLNSAARLSTGLGAAYLQAGSYRQAMTCYQDAVDYYRSVHNQFALPSLLNDLGLLYGWQGDYDEALRLLEDAVRTARQIGNLRIEALALASTGDLYRDIGLNLDARQAYEQAHQILINLADQFMLLYLHLALAEQARIEGDMLLAETHLKSAENYLQRSPTAYGQALFATETARTALAAGEYARAVELLEAVVESFLEGNQKIEACKALVYMALACLEGRDLDGTIRQIRQFFQISSQLENRHTVLLACQEAKKVFEQAVNFPNVRYSAQQILDSLVDLEQQLAAARQRLRYRVTVLPLATPRINIQALGFSRVTLGKRTLTGGDWQTQKTRDLFFLLLHHPAGMTKEALGEILWPESSAGQLKLRFKNTLYRLRRAFDLEVIVLEDDRYYFNRSLDYHYDAEAFWDLVERARKEPDPDQQARFYEQAASLYEGPFLPDIYDTWVIPERERLWQAYVQAKLFLMDRAMEKEAYPLVVELGSSLLAEDPCLEEAHRKIMVAYAKMGNRTAVYRQYVQCQNALLKEHNLPPSEQTNHLYHLLTS